MEKRKRMTLKKQLGIALFLVGLIPFAVIAIISYFNASEALRDEAEAKLRMAKDLKKHELKTYVDIVDNSISTLGKSKDVVDIVNELVHWHNVYNVEAKGAFDITSKTEVLEVYNNYDDYFQEFMDSYDLYDLFIICKKHGHVMYSVTKESDLGTNLQTGPYNDSGLAKVWKRAVETKKTVFADLEPYAPSGGAPAMFMATPIYDQSGSMRGVAAVQLSLEVINEIMMNRAGMGETGETYLVGQDHLMRSDSFLDPENRTVEASFANPSQGSVNTVTANKALQGQEGIELTTDYMGSTVLSAYTPVEIFGVTWALLAEADETEVFGAVYNLRNITIIIGAVFLALIIGIAYLLGTYISRPIIHAVDVISDGSMQVVSASDQIAGSSQTLAEGSTEQASSVEEVTASVESTTSLNSRNSDSAREADTLASEADAAATKGNERVKSLMQSMENITEASGQIAKIIKTIDEIAFQTNLLALNAAVEAARAGEHGQGFAVVADEVKSLAQRSADAAKETTGIIEKAIDQIKEGSKIAKDTDEAFEEINSKIKNTSTLISEIAASIKEQSEGMAQVSEAMSQIDQVTQSNAATSEEAAAAAQELNAQSNLMMESVKEIGMIVGVDIENKESNIKKNRSKKKDTKRLEHKRAHSDSDREF